MSTSSIEARKLPVQARSRARVEIILNSAKEIISEVGSDGLKMNALAQRSEVPIGTVYQFFPNKSAVIHTLVQSVMDQVRATFDMQFQNITSLENAAERVDQAIRAYYAFLRAEPLVRSILGSTQGDKKLQILDQEDSRQNGEMLFNKIKAFVEPADQSRAAATCFLNMHLIGALVRLTVTLDDETAEHMLDQFIKSAQRDLIAMGS